MARIEIYDDWGKLAETLEIVSADAGDLRDAVENGLACEAIFPCVACGKFGYPKNMVAIEWEINRCAACDADHKAKGDEMSDVYLYSDTNSTLFTKCCGAAVTNGTGANAVFDTTCPRCKRPIHANWQVAFRESMTPEAYAKHRAYVNKQIARDRQWAKDREARQAAANPVTPEKQEPVYDLGAEFRDRNGVKWILFENPWTGCCTLMDEDRDLVGLKPHVDKLPLPKSELFEYPENWTPIP